MPSWRVHRRFGRLLGFDERLMRSVDRMLDYPEAYGIRLKHRALQNWTVVVEAYARHGVEWARYAVLHVSDDAVRGQGFCVK